MLVSRELEGGPADGETAQVPVATSRWLLTMSGEGEPDLVAVYGLRPDGRLRFERWLTPEAAEAVRLADLDQAIAAEVARQTAILRPTGWWLVVGLAAELSIWALAAYGAWRWFAG